MFLQEKAELPLSRLGRGLVCPFFEPLVPVVKSLFSLKPYYSYSQAAVTLQVFLTIFYRLRKTEIWLQTLQWVAHKALQVLSHLDTFPAPSPTSLLPGLPSLTLSRRAGLPDRATAPALPSAWDTRDPDSQRSPHWGFPDHSICNRSSLPLHSLSSFHALFWSVTLTATWCIFFLTSCMPLLTKSQHYEGRDLICFVHCYVPSIYNNAWHIARAQKTFVE